MAEEIKKEVAGENPQPEEVKVAYSYVVTRKEDGSVDVHSPDGSIEDANIFVDIKNLGELYEENKEARLVEAACERAAYRGAYYGTMKALEDWEARKNATASEAKVEM